jgi:hypothetical protein
VVHTADASCLMLQPGHILEESFAQSNSGIPMDQILSVMVSATSVCRIELHTSEKAVSERWYLNGQIFSSGGIIGFRMPIHAL